MKKPLLIAALVVVAVCQTLITWNAHLYDRARDEAAGPAAKARLLELAARVYPWNDQVDFELGKTFFARGSESLGDASLRDRAFAQSVGYFLKALRLNPGSAATHLYLAQSLQYMSYLSLPTTVGYFGEYRKAAALTGHDSEIYCEVGTVLLASWESLRPEEREFTLDVLGKMLAGAGREKFRDLLEVWYLHGRDYSIIDGIMPDDPGLERAYARFLGEMSLSLEVRQKALARAEFLDFVKAKDELSQGQRGYEYFQSQDAAGHLITAARLLESIRFYESLVRESLIDPAEYAQVLKTTYLLLAEIQAEKTRALSEPDGYLEKYLALETDPLAAGEFEQFLKDRNLLEDVQTAAARPKDLRALAIGLRLDFKQNKYRDIAQAGETLEKSAYIIPPAGTAYYVRILELAGDSFEKLDDIYEAENYDLKALAADPDDLEGLIRLERCYDRLNDDPQRVAVRRRIDGLLTPREVIAEPRVLRKDEPLEIRIVGDGSPVSMTVSLAGLEPGNLPLLSVFFNGRAVWEGYAQGGSLSFSLSPRTGANTLVMEAVNRPVTVASLEWSRAPRGE